MLTERTDRAWFSRLLLHLVLTTPEPTQGCFLAVGTTKPCRVWLPKLYIYLFNSLAHAVVNTLKFSPFPPQISTIAYNERIQYKLLSFT